MNYEDRPFRKLTADEFRPRRKSQLERTSHQLMMADSIKRLKKSNVEIKDYVDIHGKLPEIDELIRVLTKEVDDVFADIDDLLSDGISFGEITAFISNLVEAAQVLFQTFGGGVKHEVVMKVFEHYDKRYDIISQLINAMPVPIPIIGRMIQRKVYKFVIGLFVKVVVKMMKITGAFK